MFRRLILLAAVALACLQAAHAQGPAYPNRPVRIVVPYATGGPTDQLARAVAQKLQDAWGKPVIVDNRPGGGGQIAAQIVKQADADGHTLFLGATEMFAINQFLYRNFSYDPRSDFRMVAPLLSIPMLLVVPRDLPVESLSDLIALAKRPQGLSFASQGVGSIGHMLGLQFAQRIGARLAHVPYKGSMPALQDLIGGQPDMMFDVAASSGPFIAAGKLKALAIAAPARGATLPGVRTLSEAGLSGLDASVWMALALKSGTPAEIVNRINGQVGRIMQSPEVTKRFTDQGWASMAMGLPELERFVDGEVGRWSALVKSSGATAE